MDDNSIDKTVVKEEFNKDLEDCQKLMTRILLNTKKHSCLSDDDIGNLRIAMYALIKDAHTRSEELLGALEEVETLGEQFTTIVHEFVLLIKQVQERFKKTCSDYRIFKRNTSVEFFNNLYYLKDLEEGDYID